MSHELIECQDHKFAPWAIVCVHLMDGTSREWVALPNEHGSAEVEYDWLCPECDLEQQAIFEEQRPHTEEEMNHLKCVCIHCIRTLRKMYDPNFEE